MVRFVHSASRLFYANDHIHCVQFLMYITPYTLSIIPIPDMLLPRGRVSAARTTSAAAAKPGCRTQTTRGHLPQWTTSGEATLHAYYAVLLVLLKQTVFAAGLQSVSIVPSANAVSWGLFYHWDGGTHPLMQALLTSPVLFCIDI